MKWIIALITLLSIVSFACAQGASESEGKTVVLLFWSKTCPHCAKEKPFLQQLSSEHPQLEVRYFEVSENETNAQLYSRMAEACGQKPLGVPATFINGDMILGYDEALGADIKGRILDCLETGDCIDPMSKLAQADISAGNQTCENKKTITVPFLGEIDPTRMSLPVFTVVIAGLDSINPCAFFVLFFLLSLLINAQSRRRMLFIGGTFVIFSAFIYFIFMAAWLNFFLIMGQLKAITLIAGAIAVIVSVINIKDFFHFKKGLSLSIPESAKPKLFARMRNLVRATELPSMLFGTVFLAVAANTYELLCTAGFPMVYTRFLTLNHLSTLDYYIYLASYNIIYVIPLFLIVLMFTLTLGSKKLTEDEGRILKLLSGLMMLFLGLILLFDPELLQNVLLAVGILALSIVITAAFFLIERAQGKKQHKHRGKNTHTHRHTR